MIKKKKNQLKNRQYQRKYTHHQDLPFREHLNELRRRLMYIAATVAAGATIAYFIQQVLVHLLLRPSHGQQFIYTSPAGGITFLFDVCIYFGVALAIPVIIYQALRFTEPLIKSSSKKTLIKFSLLSGGLALLGICFGYLVGLPTALKFLQHQFTTSQIRPLFTIQEYMSFVTFYLLGSALLFQTPLIISFIDRIKPLKPKRLFHYERYVIVAAFIIAAIMSPSVNIISQLVVAIPIIFAYQVGIFVVWMQSRSRRTHYSKTVIELMKRDEENKLRRATVNARAPSLAHSSVKAIPAAARAVNPILNQKQPEPVKQVTVQPPVRRTSLVNNIVHPKPSFGTGRFNFN